eukprot:2681017-Karenia_brevis.AAC.1
MPENSGYHLPWSILLAYELEIRRDAYRRVAEERTTISIALEAPRDDIWQRRLQLRHQAVEALLNAR